MKDRGFTLIEIIIALSLTAVIAVILYSAMGLGYRSVDRGQEREDTSQRIRIAVARITDIIHGAYPFFGTIDNKRVLYFLGDKDRLGIVTSDVDPDSTSPIEEPGLKWVSLFVDDGLKLREKIFYDKDVFEDKGGRLYVLDPDVDSISFEYFDMDNKDKTGSWVSEWDPKKDRLPKAIKVSIVLKGKRGDIKVPPFIVSIMAYKR